MASESGSTDSNSAQVRLGVTPFADMASKPARQPQDPSISISVSEKAGMSSGLRLVMKRPSTATS